MSDDIHEVYAVRYAGHEWRTSENYIFGDPTYGRATKSRSFPRKRESSV